MIEILSPDDYKPFPRERCVFFGGSIEMGRAKDWQYRLLQLLGDTPGWALNPRRRDWDATWEQGQYAEPFRSQVLWELGARRHAATNVFFFDPDTQSPITLLELGLAASEAATVNGLDQEYIVCCPDGYFRKGNVDIVCEKYGLWMVSNLDALAEATRRVLASGRMGG